MQKKLTAGTASRLLKITKGSVLNYEELGLVHAQRDPENGYRYFSDVALDDLRKIRSFRSMGFSLKETREISACGGPEELCGILDRKKKTLEEEIRRIQDQLRAIDLLDARAKAVADRPRECQITESPRLLWMPMIDGSSTEEARIAIEAAWAEQMPQVTISSIIRLTEQGIQQQMGFTVPWKSQPALGLPLCQQARCLQPQRAVYTIIEYSYEEKSGYDKETFVPLYDFAREKGLVPDGDILLRGLLTLNPREERRYYAQVWLPVKASQ